MRVTDIDLSLDLVRSDIFSGEGDSVYFEAHVTVHITGMGELQVRNATRVPATSGAQQN